MDRRQFLRAGALAGAACLIDFQEAFARGAKDPLAGRPWQGWRKGQFQVHFIYTGVAESMFMIFPDATTMLLDCGDHNAVGRGKLAHSDHGGHEGFYASREVRDGREYALSGFSQAAEWLTFRKAFDRCWPSYDDPIPLLDHRSADCVEQMRRFYIYMARHRGLQVEKFRLGETNQVAMLHRPGAYPQFSVFNLCANGRIASPDGQVTDLYRQLKEKENPWRLNENGMSLGMIISYGPFRFFTAGDFSDRFRQPDGTTMDIEEQLARVCPPVSVAKLNHHGHYSMPAQLVSALRARVYVSCVWDQLHNVAPVMARLSDRTLYPGERLLCPGIMPAERRAEDAGQPWLQDVAPASFDGGHVVLNVEKGGHDYSISYLTAADESMTVKSVMHFKT